MIQSLPKISYDWTLFLDRDGVINKHMPDAYVTCIDEFEFIPGCIEAINKLSLLFHKIIIVTNQQGIGKGLMTSMDLEKIHFYMLEEISKHGGRIDAVYYCPYLSNIKPKCRKPEIGMALQAKEAFPSIDFKKSIMIGDSPSDMLFGKNIGAYTVLAKNKNFQSSSIEADYNTDSLAQFANYF